MSSRLNPDVSVNVPLTCSTFPGHLCIICAAIHVYQGQSPSLVHRSLSEIIHIAAMNVLMVLAANTTRALAHPSTAVLGSASEHHLLVIVDIF